MPVVSFELELEELLVTYTTGKDYSSSGYTE